MSAKQNKKANKADKQAKPTKRAKTKSESASLETGGLDAAPMLGGSDAVLGTLSIEPDAPSAERAAESHAKGAGEANPAETKTAPAAPAHVEPLRVARGGFIAFRKSGGLAFTSDEVLLYPDGRVAYDVRGVPQKEYNRLRRMLNDAQVLSLRKLLDQSGFWRMESSDKQNPDAYAYEIAARLGQRSNLVQVADGSVPDELAPLIERLNKLLPER